LEASNGTLYAWFRFGVALFNVLTALYYGVKLYYIAQDFHF
jgi:hypothetical protein